MNKDILDTITSYDELIEQYNLMAETLNKQREYNTDVQGYLRKMTDTINHLLELNMKLSDRVRKLEKQSISYEEIEIRSLN